MDLLSLTEENASSLADVKPGQAICVTVSKISEGESGALNLEIEPGSAYVMNDEGEETDETPEAKKPMAHMRGMKPAIIAVLEHK